MELYHVRQPKEDKTADAYLACSSDNEASAVDTSSDMSCNDWNKSYIIFITMELFLMD
jgi:hypothetical protein